MSNLLQMICDIVLAIVVVFALLVAIMAQHSLIAVNHFRHYRLWQQMDFCFVVTTAATCQVHADARLII